MLERIVTIKNRLGLHARPAAMLVQTLSKFKSKVKILKGDQEVDGKSIMGIMTLAAARGTELRIIVEGIDEVATANEVMKLLESGFGED
ncbi:MAG: HPr family phosphocarrier protein [Elusimicrobia bacterium]|nr:HPr family phosphocarrier protein [Candidatus Liberimonas magnetica]